MLGVLVVSCAPKAPIVLPSGPGTAFPDFAAVHATLSAACAGVRTLTAELGLSGRAAGEKIGGRVIAGFERPASMRLQGVGPLLVGTVFTLVSRDGKATLVLTREERILRNEAPEAILEAMTGVALAPADLQAVFTGCVVTAPRAVSGAMHADGWASLEIETGPQEATRRTATLFLRRSGSQWQLRAARRERWQIEYTASAGPFPQSVRLVSESPDVNINANLSQIETNADIDPAAFRADEPKGVTPITLKELRDVGPLREK